MTRLTVFVRENKYLGFSCKGHSGYSEEGSDIVCASISVAVQLTASYLSKYHNDGINFVCDEKNARIELRCKNWFEEAQKQISVLVDFASFLQDQYSEYFTFDYLEV